VGTADHCSNACRPWGAQARPPPSAAAQVVASIPLKWLSPSTLVVGHSPTKTAGGHRGHDDRGRCVTRLGLRLRVDDAAVEGV